MKSRKPSFIITLVLAVAALVFLFALMGHVS